jgi:hypothetical protein
MNKNMKIISMTLLIVLIISGAIYVSSGQVENAPANKYRIQTGEIIAEIPNDKTVDVIVKENDDVIFYTYSVIEEDKKYKKLLESNAEDYINYQGRKNAEKNAQTRREELQIQVELTSKLYDGINKDAKRKPYWGVSISPEISELKINDNSIDKIIEYNDGKYTFYIWYFSNLDIDYTDVNITM